MSVKSVRYKIGSIRERGRLTLAKQVTVRLGTIADVAGVLDQGDVLRFRGMLRLRSVLRLQYVLRLGGLRGGHIVVAEVVEISLLNECCAAKLQMLMYEIAEMRWVRDG